MDNEHIKQARQADLATYLMSRGEQLVKNGNRYRHKQHDSLVITGNMFYWNSKGLKGNSVDFLMLFYDMDFKTAVASLTGYEIKSRVDETEIFNFNDVRISSDVKRIIAYLHKTRGIDYDLIIWLINKRLIYQEQETNNVIFPIYDENKICVGIEYHGTLSNKRFKGIAKGSKYGYGYNIIYGMPVNAVFFESSIDLISFINIKNKQAKLLKDLLLVSMGGLKVNVIQHSMQNFGIAKNPVLCVDNDEAGNNFVNLCKGYYSDLRSVMPDRGKDWNEYLKSM